jgi:undecaprenyl-diphosphatase
MLNMNLRAFDLALFQWMGATTPDPSLLQWAAYITQWAPWLCAALVALAMARRPQVSGLVLAAVALCAISSPVAQFIATELGSPRPFALGLVANHIGHGPRGGMPSTHATAMFTLAFMLLRQRATRGTGVGVAALALATGWARVYLGVHFPMDVVAGVMLAAILVGMVVAVDPALEWVRSALQHRPAKPPVRRE